jgi:GTP-binding protein Era
VVSKTDIAAHAEVAEHLAVATAKLGEFDAYVPVSGLTGDAVDALVAEIETHLPEGPLYYPNGEVTDQPETFLAAELLREKLLLVARDELPHSIAVVVEEIEPADGEDRDDGSKGDGPKGNGPRGEGIVRLRALILVERDSQKGIVIGKGGAVLKEAGTRAREELEALLGTRVYLQTQVKVERDWQRRAHSLDRLGF